MSQKQLRPVDALDFKMQVRHKKEHYYVRSLCSYPDKDQARLLIDKIQENAVIIDVLEERLQAYSDFINKYQGTLASRCTNSNYAENEAIYNELSKIVKRAKDEIASQNTVQGKCLP